MTKIAAARRKSLAEKGEGLQKTLARFLERLHLAGRSPRTIETYGMYLRFFVAWLGSERVESFGRLAASHLHRFQADLAARPGQNGGTLSAAARSIAGAALVGLVRFLRKEGLMKEDLSGAILRPRVPRKLPDKVLTVRQMERLLGAPGLEKPVELRDRALMELLYATGVRQSEALSLGLEDVDLGEGEVRVKRGKGGNGRVVPLCRESVGVLQAYLSEARPILTAKGDSGHFFVSYTGRKLTPTSMRERFQRYAAQAGIRKRVGFHTFRHSLATHLMKRGVGLRYIQELLGHASIQSTQIYTRVVAGDLKEAHAKYHPRERMNV